MVVASTKLCGAIIMKKSGNENMFFAVNWSSFPGWLELPQKLPSLCCGELHHRVKLVALKFWLMIYLNTKPPGIA